jgi:hypothetical protein
VLAAMMLCSARSARAWRRRRPFTRTDQSWLRVVVVLVDTQLLFNLLLYA